ncbi:Plasmodium vivax Vir protein, putative, partial [Plasmodium vivax]
SEQFYDKLNDDGDKNLSMYYSKCDSLITAYKDNNKLLRLRRTCALLVKYLKTSYTTMSNEKNAYNDCTLLNYWIYSTLVSIFNSDDSNIILHPLSLLQNIWNDIVDDPSYTSRINKCTPDGRMITQKDWRKRKALYDYCVNYDTIEKELPYFDHMCPKYWNYAESHTSLYEYFEKLCSESNDQCPNFYSMCKKYDPKYVLHRETFDCHAEMMDKKAKENTANARPALQAGIRAGQEANSGIITSSEVSAGGSPLTRDGSHPVEKTGNILLGVVATSLASGALYRVNIKSLIHMYRIILFKFVLYFIAIYNKYVTNILYYFFIHKFTPLGSMLRNGLGWNNNNMRNMHGGEYGLFDYATESYNPYTGGGEEHYIGYQPA